VYGWVCGCVYKIEKFRTLSAPSEIASQFPPPLRSKNALNKLPTWACILPSCVTTQCVVEAVRLHPKVMKMNPRLANEATFGLPHLITIFLGILVSLKQFLVGLCSMF
jgi:hypothetical protein